MVTVVVTVVVRVVAIVLSVEVTVDVAEVLPVEDAVLVCVDKVHMKS